MIKKEKRCSNCIWALFIFIAVSILAIFLNSHKLMSRVNKVEGPISAHLPLYSGELHYSRIPWQYWEHRIQMVRAMGFNAISVYVMWNFHEIEKGHFDYSSKSKNLTKFLELASNHNLKVILRPGPYVCGEWDFGGLPARLLGVDGLNIRTHDAKYE